MKRCRKCGAPFEPVKPLQVACSVTCARQWSQTLAARRAEIKARRKEKREALARLETPADAARKAQAVFNRWVRLIDQVKPCVSCGHPDDGSRQRHASHYRPAGSNPALRFEPDNVHAACSICNNHKSGNLTGYRLELVRRIGIERVEWLEGPHDLPHRTVADFRAIEAEYRKRIRSLEKQPEATDGQPTDQVADGPRAHDPPGDRADGAAAAVRAVPAGPG